MFSRQEPRFLPLAQKQRLLLGSMEPGADRLPIQVLGENEALQQFFNGEMIKPCCL